MIKAFKAMLQSKKAIAMIGGVLAGILGKYGLEIPAADLTAILSPVIAYIVGQGVADVGKEKARMENENDARKGAE